MSGKRPTQSGYLASQGQGTASAFAGELLLLLRLAISDAPLSERETDVLRCVAAGALGIVDLDADGLLAAVDAFGVSGGTMQARLVLREGGEEHSKLLARTLLQIAQGDPDLSPRKDQLASRIADILGPRVSDCVTVPPETYRRIR